MKKGVGLLLSMLILAATLTGCISMTPLSDAGAFPGDGAERKVRSAGGSGRPDQRYLGGYAAARGDPEDAVPRQRDPDL